MIFLVECTLSMSICYCRIRSYCIQEKTVQELIHIQYDFTLLECLLHVDNTLILTAAEFQ